MLTHLLTKLTEGQNLEFEEAKEGIEGILTSADPVQAGAFLALLRAKGETPTEVAGMAQTMRKHLIPVKTEQPVLDIVGTGGDKAHTVNISTGAALVAAACGVPVAKHGNRSVSSQCGSADVLEELGVRIHLTPDEVAQSIQEVGFGFMFAPLFHPAMKAIAPIRKSLKIRTIFNILGPLLNPAQAQYCMVGVFHPSLVDLVAHTFQKVGVKRSFVFHGCGLDEITPIGEAKGVLVEKGRLTPVTITPKQSCSLEDLVGGTAEQNAKMLENVFDGKPGPLADTLALNAGVGLWVYGAASSPNEGVEKAQAALNNGSVRRLLNSCVAFSKEVVHAS